MIKRIEHVAIAVKNLDEAVSTFENLFGLRPSKIEDIPDQGVRAAVIHIGDTELEFIEPVNPTSSVARFLESRGEGWVSSPEPTWSPLVMEKLRKRPLDDVIVIAGGIIPEDDRPALNQMGIRGIFGPGTRTPEIVDYIKKVVSERN